MNQIFTPELYDKILTVIVNDAPLGETGFFNIQKPFPYQTLSFRSLEAIFEHFENEGFIKNVNFAGYGFDDYVLTFVLTVKGLRFRDHGGFVAQEIHLKQTFEKLKLELESLKKSLPERASVFSGLLGDLATTVQAVTGVAGLL